MLVKQKIALAMFAMFVGCWVSSNAQAQSGSKMKMPDFTGVVPGSQYLESVNDQGTGFEGYDVIAAHQFNTLVPGNSSFGCQYNGANYFFSSEKNRRQFFTNPARFAPQFGGYCAMSMSKGMVEKADVRTMSIVDGRLVVQRNAKAVGMWTQNPELNLYQADQNWPVAVAKENKATEFLTSLGENAVAFDGYDPVAVHNHQKLMKGLPQYVSFYRGGLYHFSSQIHKNTFDSNPARYAPQFGGYCAMSMSMGKVEAADVKTWSIVNGRLVVQRNEKAVNMWKMNPQENLRKADMMWPKVTAKENKKG